MPRQPLFETSSKPFAASVVVCARTSCLPRVTNLKICNKQVRPWPCRHGAVLDYLDRGKWGLVGEFTEVECGKRATDRNWKRLCRLQKASDAADIGSSRSWTGYCATGTNEGRAGARAEGKVFGRRAEIDDCTNAARR